MSDTAFQVMSDLHLETHSSYDFDFPVTATRLVLLGDIGHVCDPGLFQFLEAQLRRFSTVFFLLGNHEPYHMRWDRARKIVKDFAIKADKRHQNSLAGKFVFLDQTRYDISDTVTVLGCTLFSDVPLHQEHAVETRLVDFKDIARWTIDDHNEAHQTDLKWLNGQIADMESNEPDRKIVVFTHHSPCQDDRAVKPIHRGSEVASGFVTDLSNQLCWRSKMVVAWAFGHTHYSCDFTDKGGKRVFANQKGYYLFPEAAFSAEKTLNVTSR